jgi:hypothetical protein
MRVKLFVAVLTVGAAMAGPSKSAFAGSYCMEPRAPSALFLTKPSKPYCMNGCSAWEVQNYKDQVRRYFDGLQQYADDVDRYYKSAGGYIQCMADLN